jgi:hypothetical protein
MVTCTFDGTTVPTSRITNILLLGSASTPYQYEVEVSCATPTYSVYTALAAKAGPGVTKDLLMNGYVRVNSDYGTKGTLVLNGVTMTNCVIENISNAERRGSNLSIWEFTIRFVKSTAD